MYVFKNLQAKTSKELPKHHPDLGNVAAIDGSLIDAKLSMYWADYRKGAKKAKVHVCFDLNRSIPRKIFLIAGNGVNGPLSVRSFLLQKQASWIERTNATKSSYPPNPEQTAQKAQYRLGQME